MTALDQAVTHPVQTAPTSLDRVRRTASVAALFLAPWGFAISNAGYAWAIRNGGSDDTGAQALDLVGPQPGLFRLVVVVGLVSCLLLVPAIVSGMRVASRSWLTFIGGTLMAAGYICYFGVLLTNMIVIAMAERGGPLADYAAVIDAGQQDVTTSWVFLLFVVGNLIGTLLFAIGLLRSKSIPVWAAIAIMLWPPLHVIGLVVGSELFEVTGAVLQGIGFAGIALTVLGTKGGAGRPYDV